MHLTNISPYLKKMFTMSNAARGGVLAVVVVMGAIIGPPGMAVGPTTSRTATPALPTGAAMEARTVAASVPISLDILELAINFAEGHSSYPERVIGALRFPTGAIEVPWQDHPGSSQDASPSQGSTVSAPRATQAQLNRNRVATAPSAALNDLRSMILFDPSVSDLSSDAMDMLEQVAAGMSDDNARVELRAFGGGITDRSISARRLALRRALSVRNHLMENGISQERITVRAMGGAMDGGPSDRVDVVFSGN